MSLDDIVKGVGKGLMAGVFSAGLMMSPVEHSNAQESAGIEQQVEHNYGLVGSILIARATNPGYHALADTEALLDRGYDSGLVGDILIARATNPGYHALADTETLLDRGYDSNLVGDILIARAINPGYHALADTETLLDRYHKK